MNEKTDMKEKVVFYFPWREISGGPKYLTGLANILAADGKYEIYYVDYSPGLSDQVLCDDVHKIPYEEPFRFPIRGPVTLITPIYCAPYVPELDRQSKIVFVNWHNFCINELARGWRLTDKALQYFLRMVYEHNAVFFLDKTHLLAQNEWIEDSEGYRFQERYVPPVVEPRPIGSYRMPCVADGEMNIAILGRLSEDKTYGVVNLLEHLERIETEKTIHVHIIGEGDRADRIKERRWDERLHIHMAGTVTGDKLAQYLTEKTDILFAMGLSVLEGASVGLPSVIMPHNIHPFDADRFTYLQEATGYATGWYDTQIDELGVPAHSLGEIVRDIYTDGRKTALGVEARDYLISCYAPNSRLIKDAIAASTLDYDLFSRFAVRQGRMKLLGIPMAKLSSSFDGTEKTVSAMGIKELFKYIKRGEEEKFYILGHEQNVLRVVNIGNRYYAYIRLPFIHS